jgi:hypothetical protein
MKTKTSLKTIGWFIGWLVSFQLIGVGTYLMNKPSSVAFTVGVICWGLIVVSIFTCAYKFSQAAVQLITEYRDSKDKQLNQFKQK